MSTQRLIIFACLPVLLAAGASAPPRWGSPSIDRAPQQPDACALLTPSDVSAALEVKSLAGEHPVQSSTKMCGWSDVSGVDINHRRVVLSLTSAAGFNLTKSRQSAKITIEPVSGIGDEAFYEMIGTSESPFLFVRKGTSSFSLRVLNGLKLKAFTRDEEKNKEAALAKAAAARL
jgi:hypothetical protein